MEILSKLYLELSRVTDARNVREHRLVELVEKVWRYRAVDVKTEAEKEAIRKCAEDVERILAIK
jgi:hypothetical protein